MPYNVQLASRIRAQLADQAELTEIKMFGGIGFMLRGNMACGVIGDEMCVRVGPEGHAQALALPGARPFDFSGRPMEGWVFVSDSGLRTEGEFQAWVRRGAEFALSLPPKGG